MPSRTKKFRGLRTHGRGKKSGRGAGIIGGHGNAGLGKTKKIQMLKNDRNYFGRQGFKRPQCTIKVNRTINVGELAEKLDYFVSSGSAKKNDDVYEINLTDIGVDKLLGTGNIDIKVKIVANQASAIALKKIQDVGGSVINTNITSVEERI